MPDLIVELLDSAGNVVVAYTILATGTGSYVPSEDDWIRIARQSAVEGRIASLEAVGTLTVRVRHRNAS